MQRLSLILVLLLVNTAYSQNAAESEEEKRTDIRRLLKLTGAGDVGKQVATQLIEQMKAVNPSIPQQFWTDFAKEIKPEELIEITVPVYEKHLTHEEIKQLIRFYESPIGKKFVKVQPMIVKDSMMAGQKWGQGLSLKVIQKLRQQGL